MENDKSSYKDLVWNTKPPTLSDIKDIIKKFKRGKAPGPNGITTDLVKDLDDDSLDEIRKLFRSWRLKRKVPNTLTLVRVVSLYKKGDPAIQENYRPIFNNRSCDSKKTNKDVRQQVDEHPIWLQERQTHKGRHICRQTHD